MVNNGRVLMTINLLREKYNALRSVEKGLKAEGLERQEFIDSVNFLHEEGYIYLRDMESREPANLADVEYQTLEAKVTGKGIRLLGGGITDEMVDLDGGWNRNVEDAAQGRWTDCRRSLKTPWSRCSLLAALTKRSWPSLRRMARR